MEKTSNSHEYESLNVGSHEIRLLELLPVVDDTQVCGRLIKQSLDQSPVYDALSYTWGDPTQTVSITIDGDPAFQVTANLGRALQYLRLEQDVRTIWIDSICINQKDVKERSEQVSLMRKIYSNAATVRVWLDLEVNPADPAYNKLWFLQTIGDSGVGDEPEIWNSIAHIFLDLYWYRLWV